MSEKHRIWILIDPLKCTGCRLCEVACSLKHHGLIWPSASRIQVFEPYPGAPIPLVCIQCHDYPCVNSCPFSALGVDEKTGAVIVYEDKCTLCGTCVQACPVNIPRVVPGLRSIQICDLCGGEPECVKTCESVGYYALKIVSKPEGGVEKTFLVDPYSKSREIYERIVLGGR